LLALTRCVFERKQRREMSQLNGFLRAAAVAVSRRSPVTMVLGNEGGDMDSVVGAIFLAYYLNHQHASSSSQYVPVMNFPRDDMALRGDIVEVLRRFDVDVSLLTHVGDDSWPSLSAGSTPTVLVDHNKLCPAMQQLQAHVVGIVDHHADEGLNGDVSLRVVAPVGSCCSLVTELMQRDQVVLPDALMLHAPILLDTMNGNPKMRKATRRDIAAGEYLQSLHHNDATSLTTLYDALLFEKFNVSNLTPAQALRRDFKRFEMKSMERNVAVGIAAWAELFQTVMSRVARERFENDMDAHCALHNLDILGVMFCAEHDGCFTRQILFFARSEMRTAVLALCRDFCSSPTGDRFNFAAVASAVADSPSFCFFEQHDVVASRKVLVPVLSEFLASAQFP
jgi:exopolyphosphatase